MGIVVTAPQGVRGLVQLAVALRAERLGGPLSGAEKSLRDEHFGGGQSVDAAAVRARLVHGEDVFAEAYLESMSSDARYHSGTVLTPPRTVKAMIARIARAKPKRVVDMGCGTGRFAAEAARRLPTAEIVAVDSDPLATLLTRGWLAALGHRHARVVCGDYVGLRLDQIQGVTAFVGNPPYVRHHELDHSQKVKAADLARGLGFDLSGLSGLHAHFVFATAANAVPGDVGCVITSAEWMMVSYGQAVRDLLAGPMGLEALHVLDPKAMAFPGTMTTAVILTFRVAGRHREVTVTPHGVPETLGRPNGRTWRIPRAKLTGTSWGYMLWGGRPVPERDEGLRLRDVFRVHRGIATGDNSFFVMTAKEAKERGLLPWVRPVLTRAREVIDSSGVVRTGTHTRLILSPSKNVDLDAPSCAPLRDYLSEGERRGVPQHYLCAHRRPWWWLGEPEPAPVLATYMARRPPLFAWNPDRVINLNVIHGLYPRKPLPEDILQEIVARLNAGREQLRGQGRVYQGGLEKFEPRELEAVRLPFDRRVMEEAGTT